MVKGKREISNELLKRHYLTCSRDLTNKEALTTQ